MPREEPGSAAGTRAAGGRNRGAGGRPGLLRREWRALLAAAGFLTRLPLPRWLPDAAALGASVAWFPLVGALVGGLAALALLAAAWLWPSPLPALAAVAAAVLATGGFHEDGLADSADALAAGGDLERRLRVMDDPRVGAVGAVALVLVLLGRVAALALLPLAAAAAALVAAHALARWTVPALLWRLPYLRGESGVAAALAAGATGRRLGGATALALLVLVAVVLAGAPLAALLADSFAGAGTLPLVVAPPPAADPAAPLAPPWISLVGPYSPAALAAAIVTAVAAILLVTLAAGRFLRRAFGGVTGDLLGAVCQLAELAVYLAVLAVIHRGG